MLSKNNDFHFKNLKNTTSPKNTSKYLKEPLIKSYERFKSHNSEKWKIKSDFLLGNSQEYSTDGKQHVII